MDRTKEGKKRLVITVSTILSCVCICLMVSAVRYDAGVTAGYAAGEKTGYRFGYEAGEQIGYAAGFAEGEASGYEAGLLGSETARLVYVTPEGEKYHGETCPYAREKGVGVTAEQAEALGYEPCSRCGRGAGG